MVPQIETKTRKKERHKKKKYFLLFLCVKKAFYVSHSKELRIISTFIGDA
jgi:hypothetical protein